MDMVGTYLLVAHQHLSLSIPYVYSCILLVITYQYRTSVCQLYCGRPKSEK